MTDRMDDLAFQDGGQGLDPEYEAQFAEGIGEDESERQVGFDPLPKGKYLMRPVRAIGDLSREKKSPFCKPTCEVVKGAGDTVGRRVFDAGGIYFKAAPTSYNRRTKQQETLDPVALKKKRKARNDLLTRIARRIGLKMDHPPNFQQQGCEVYAAQFEQEGLNDFIIDLKVEKGLDGVMRNRFVWESIAAPSDEMKNSAGEATGKTALQDLEESIEKADKANASKRGGSRGSTVGQFAGTNPLS
jgi:hypothetical protein